MSLLSLCVFASVCLMLEPIHVMFVRLDVVAGAQCQTRPFPFRAGGSHCVFVVLSCWLSAQTRSHLFCAGVILSRQRMCGVWAPAPLQLLTPFGN